MSEQQDIIGDLGDAGILAGVRWAYLSAVSRALEIYSEADGHDVALLGFLRFTYFRDRLDRVFACKKYAVSAGRDAADLDLLYVELSEGDIETMPHLAADLVYRADLTGSPGWAVGGRRFLLASGDFGKLGQLPWPQKSPTKQRVARQPSPEPSTSQPSLFDDSVLEELAGLEDLRAAEPEPDLDLETFVVGHSLDPVSQQVELVFGRPRLNYGGGQAWHWWEDLLTMLPEGSGRRPADAPVPAGPNAVPDAPVRLRRRASERRDVRASGQQ